MLLGRCEFAKDDYSLNIIDMPQMEEEDEEPDMEVSEDSIDKKVPLLTEKTLFD